MREISNNKCPVLGGPYSGCEASLTYRKPDFGHDFSRGWGARISGGSPADAATGRRRQDGGYLLGSYPSHHIWRGAAQHGTSVACSTKCASLVVRCNMARRLHVQYPCRLACTCAYHVPRTDASNTSPLLHNGNKAQIVLAKRCNACILATTATTQQRPTRPRTLGAKQVQPYTGHNSNKVQGLGNNPAALQRA